MGWTIFYTQKCENVLCKLHSDYCVSRTWQASFLASLILTERNEIGTLVTGLPVSYHSDKVLRNQLQVLTKSGVVAAREFGRANDFRLDMRLLKDWRVELKDF